MTHSQLIWNRGPISACVKMSVPTGGIQRGKFELLDRKFFGQDTVDSLYINSALSLFSLDRDTVSRLEIQVDRLCVAGNESWSTTVSPWRLIITSCNYYLQTRLDFVLLLSNWFQKVTQSHRGRWQMGWQCFDCTNMEVWSECHWHDESTDVVTHYITSCDDCAFKKVWWFPLTTKALSFTPNKMTGMSQE